MSELFDDEITIAMMRERLYAAVVCDALDTLGLRRQAVRTSLPPRSVNRLLVGRCKTMLWADIDHEDLRPYDLELRAVDSCRPDDVVIAAAGGSSRSGIWGELLATAARNAGCAGAVVYGAVRDVEKMRRLDFPVFASTVCPYDSLNRQRVIDVDVPVDVDGVIFTPGDLVFADEDGVVVVPQRVEDQVVRRAWKKVRSENSVREAIRHGMTAGDAYGTFGIL